MTEIPREPGLPRVVSGGRFARASATGRLLSTMLAAHRPEAWYFGHHHRAKAFKSHGVAFRCLGIAETALVEI